MTGKVTVMAEGRRHRLGRTHEYGGIWRKRPWGWRLVSRYPLTDDAWRVAQDQFAAWEPEAAAYGGTVPSASGMRAWRWAVLAAAIAVLVGVISYVIVGGGSSARVSTAGSGQPGAPAEPASSTPIDTAPATPAVGSGYLATGDGWVAFLQWNDQEGAVSGTLETVTTTNSPPNEKTQADTSNVAGSIKGSSISLSFDGSPDQFGTVYGGSFTINVPQADGSLAAITFHAATAQDYNNALSALNAGVDAANGQAAQAQALAAREQQIAKDASTVSSDISGIANTESSLGQAVQAIPSDLKHQATDLATTHTEEQKVDGEAKQYPDGNNGQVCYDAGTVSYDAGTVSYEAGTVSYDAGSVSNDLSALRSGTSGAGIGQDFAKLQTDESNVPGYLPTGTPTQHDVDQAISAAQAAIASALATTNGYIDQANANVTTAFGYAAQAFQAGGCGEPPAAASPQSHIS